MSLFWLKFFAKVNSNMEEIHIDLLLANKFFVKHVLAHSSPVWKLPSIICFERILIHLQIIHLLF